MVLGIIFFSSLPAQEFLMERANQAVSEGKYKMALKIYQKALEKGANQAIVHYNMGNVFYRQNNVARAIYYYRNTIAIAPNFKNAYLNMAKINYSHEEYFSAIDTVKSYLNRNPYDVESLVLIAAIYRKTRNFTLAEKNLYDAQKLDPYYEDIYFEYADLFYELGDIDKALKHVQEGARAIPESIYLKEQEARLYSEKHDYKNSANTYLSILAEFTNISEEQAYFYRCDIADCFLNTGLTNSAILELQKAAQSYPKKDTAFYILNSIYIDNNRILEGVEFYRKIFAKNPIIRDLIKDLFTIAYNQNNKIYISQFIKLYEDLGLKDELYNYIKENS